MNRDIAPFDHCPALDGYHCQTNSLAKMFYFYRHPLSEEMLLGLGAGMGFIYWHTKGGRQAGPKSEFGDITFIGGRGNNKNFFHDIGQRTGIEIEVKSTASEKKAETILLEKLRRKEPSMVYGDMCYLPWFDMPEEYHFGGHTFVICGFDGENTALASDMDQKAVSPKKGFYYPISLEQLRKARGSLYKPFPPRNTYLEFDFKNFREPGTADIYAAIRQAVEAQLHPPIKNIGIKGIRHAAREIKRWPGIFEEKELRMNLFNLYIFIEIGGTGGGCFRYMYARFLEESAKISGNKKLAEAAAKIEASGKLFSEIGRSFENADKDEDIETKIETAGDRFAEIADIEDEAFHELESVVG